MKWIQKYNTFLGLAIHDKFSMYLQIIFIFLIHSTFLKWKNLTISTNLIRLLKTQKSTHVREILYYTIYPNERIEISFDKLLY